MSELLYSFGIITDTHVKPPQGDESSPFPVNNKANGRARYAANLLAQQTPAFTIHMGDVVHTLPHMPLYDDACVEALAILEPLQPNLYFMPGNHDIGDKPMPASPAASVTHSAAERYHKHFGDAWKSFEHQGCLFVIINSSLVNSGHDSESIQAAWLEKTLTGTKCERVFLFSHYPPFIHAEDEAEHYDNIASPGREWLLTLAKEQNVEVLFSGHVHQFFYNTIDKLTLYCLPPTSFIRQDYAELFKVEPGSEFGRDDAGKFSVAMVDVYSDRHQLRVIPTDGRMLDAGTKFTGDASLAIADRNSVSDFCVPLRHAWHENIDLPYNGPMEEYSRKRARNDYTLLRLLQMNINQVRIPIQDLQDELIRSRVQDYHQAGVRFHVFILGEPDALVLDTIVKHGRLVASLELVSPVAEPALLLSDGCMKLMDILRQQDISLILSKAHSSAHAPVAGKTFAHSVSNGFLPSDSEALNRWLDDQSASAPASAQVSAQVSGILYQIPLECDPAMVLKELHDTYASRQESIFANVKFADSNPANANYDDEAILARFTGAQAAAQSLGDISLQFDTFMDIDRGYNPRHGFIDRSFNFRPLGRLLLSKQFQNM